MNRSIALGKKTIPVWFLVATMIGAGSMAIATTGGAVHQESAPDIQHTSDVKIHLQDVDGKINTNVPVAASRAFSPLPIEFDEVDTLPSVISGGTAGSSISTKQKAVINLALDVSEDAQITFFINNRSEDTQIFLIKVGAPSNVMVDFESKPSGFATIHGLVGHNEWLASVPTGGFDLAMEISTTDAGMYPIVVELLRVG